jgi:hypothetical protein
MTNGLLAVNSLLLYLPLFLLLKPFNSSAAFVFTSSLAFSLNGRFCFFLCCWNYCFSCVTSFFVLFIKSVKVDVPCFSNRSFAVVPIDLSD